MNLTTLQDFLAVAREMNITKAAQQLHVTQQTLSERISRLEREYNTRLFIRTPRLRLTPAGERMVVYAERMLALEQQCRRDMARTEGENRLSVGIRMSLCQAILPKVLPAFSRTHPDVRLYLTSGTSQTLRQMMQRGQLDVCIGSPRVLLHPDFTCVLLPPDPFVAVIPDNLLQEYFHLTGEEVRAGARPDFHALQDVPLLVLRDRSGITQRATDCLLDSCGILRTNILLESHSIDTNLLACSVGLGVAFVQQRTAENFRRMNNSPQPLYLFPFETPGVNLQTVIACPRDAPPEPAARDFIRLVEEAF